MLELAINGIDLGRGRGGNESYLQGLIAGLDQSGAVSGVQVLVGNHAGNLHAGPRTRYIQTGPYHRITYLLRTQTRILRQLKFDWYLSTFFLPFNAPPRNGLFVHDLSFLSLPLSYPPTIRLYMRWLVARAVTQAQRVFVLSQFVRAEFLRHYPAVSPERVAVLYPGYADNYRPEREVGDFSVLARHSLQRGYILSVSSIHPRKNMAGLLDAYRVFSQRGAGAAPRLVIAGQQYWGNLALQQQAAGLDIQLLGYVPQTELPALHRNAGAFVYPSLYEGFGLPPLEAMACGTPVICGNNTSLPEVVGAAACQVDVSSPPTVADALQRILMDGTFNAQLSQAGIARAAQFNWQKTARELVAVLEACTH